ncbi:MAG: adenine-specific methyltransferase EcoRI family protein [Paludibacteraceae bacterium]|nr:adenine-specific methyltransferase EcoRI family protein [Paludibacteraceae bacterium]
MARKDLAQAKDAKKDEFYTKLDDIAKELKNYRPYFKDKVVFCNCDDPYESNFFKYFALNFNALGLKKLIATCYNGSPIAGDELPLIFEIEESEPKKIAYKVEITEVHDYNNDGAINLADVQYLIQNEKNVLSILKGNGSFDSPESIELLKEADIVVTNPPFSLFKEFLMLLDKYNKQFLIIGNTNALKYKLTFKMFQEDKIRTGYTNFNVGMFFQVPDSWEKFHHIENGKKMARVSTSCWFTNLPVAKHNEELILYKHYTEEEYPEYDNYKAINVSTYTDIPCDYDGVMGVPITFLDKYNPQQFEIIWTTDRGGDGYLEDLKKPWERYDAPVLKGKGLYTRILIKRKK